MFTRQELDSPELQRLREHLRALLAKYRAQNDDASLDSVATARLRGRIAEAKELLALVEPPPARANEADPQAFADHSPDDGIL